MESAVSATQGANAFGAFNKGAVNLDSPVMFIQAKKPIPASDNGWTEKEGVIYFSVMLDGTKGPDWTKRLENKNIRSGYWAQKALLADGFKPSPKGKVTIAIIKGKVIEDRKRSFGKILLEGERRRYVMPGPDVSCLIRERLSDEDLEDMGLYSIVTMHRPIIVDSYPYSLSASRGTDCARIDAYSVNPDELWKKKEYGFAFIASS